MGLGTLFGYNLATNSQSVLVPFQGAAGDPAAPFGGLLSIGSTLYGTTSVGGIHGQGTIYNYNVNTNSLGVTYSFAGAPNDGGSPIASLIQSNGTLYGVTNLGGKFSEGSLFSYDLNTDTENVLHSFEYPPATDVEYPNGTPVQVGSVIYGTSQDGGKNGFGGIYQYNLQTNSESLLYSFAGGTGDGKYPTEELTVSGSTLYGAASGGADGDGVIFQYNLNTDQESILYNFSGGTNDGSGPFAPVLYNSVLYGVADAGGSSGAGAVYSYSLNTRQESLIYSFGGAPGDGADPEGALLLSGNILYGVTFQGGSENDGTIYSIQVPEPGCSPLFAMSAIALFFGRSRNSRRALIA